MIGIGIDTGGTYTDAILYNLDSQEVLASAKSRTTHKNLEAGITRALQKLSPGLLKKADFLALSTTLATNACVEGIGGRTKLIFINVERKTVAEFYESYGLPHPNEILFLDTQEENWEAALEAEIPALSNYENIAVVQIYAREDNALLEKRVRELIQQKLSVNCVCGYELFRDLNVLRRGSSAYLNARLIPVIREFIAAIQKSLERLELHNIPIVIVRSDGSVMSLDFALTHPIETLLSGPASSAIAGAGLTKEPDALIIDMGGTTTDIAILENNRPVTVQTGVSIGNCRTFVKGLYVDTFGLGGDSAVRYHFDSREPYLDVRRVIPLCVLAEEYPQVTEELRELTRSQTTPHYKFLHEFLVLAQDIGDSPAFTESEKELCRILRDGPLILSNAAEKMGKDVYSLNTKHLEDAGVIIRSGLTPTDVMHVRGDYSRFCTEAAHLGVQYMAMCTGRDAEEFCGCIYEQVEKKLYCGIVKVLLEHQDSFYEKSRNQKLMERFIEDSYLSAKSRKPLFCCHRFTTKAVLIGIGAPIHIFLTRTAALLGTKAVLPQSASVANALGAVLGNITADFQVEIKPVYKTESETDYLVFGVNEIFRFSEYEEAKEKAVSEAMEGARLAAIERGAKNVVLSCASDISNPRVESFQMFLKEVVTGRAKGSVW